MTTAEALIAALALRSREAVIAGADPFTVQQIVELTLQMKRLEEAGLVGASSEQLAAVVALGGAIAGEKETDAQRLAHAWARETASRG